MLPDAAQMGSVGFNLPFEGFWMFQRCSSWTVQSRQYHVWTHIVREYCVRKIWCRAFEREVSWTWTKDFTIRALDRLDVHLIFLKALWRFHLHIQNKWKWVWMLQRWPRIHYANHTISDWFGSSPHMIRTVGPYSVGKKFSVDCMLMLFGRNVHIRIVQSTHFESTKSRRF